MPKIALTDNETRLKSDLQDRITELYRQPRVEGERWRAIQDELGALANELHMSLKARGYEPRHTRMMRDARRVQPEDQEFYRHVHPVEDLMKFLEDTDANRDPEDVTIGSKFRFTVFSRRWGHTDDYELIRTAEGWTLNYNLYSGPCDKTGVPWLYKSLSHDSINYPEALGGYLEYLWQQAADEGLSEVEVQAAVDALGAWVQTCEQHSPGGVFSAYK